MLTVSENRFGLPVVQGANGVVWRVDSSGQRVGLGERGGVFVDVSAPPGSWSYTDGSSTSRPVSVDAAGGLYLSDGTRLEVFNANNHDPVDYDSGAKTLNLISGGVSVMLPLAPPAHEVKIDCYVPHSTVRAVRRIAASGLVWMRQADPTTTVVPLVRLVAVKSVDTKRLYETLQFTVTGTVLWDSQVGGDLPAAGVVGASGGALLGATYQQARDHRFTFGSGSYADLVRVVQGVRV